MSWLLTFIQHFLAVRASDSALGTLHRRIVHSLLRAPLSFFDGDATLGSLLSLFSADIAFLEENTYFASMWFMMGFNFTCVIIVMTIAILPWFALPLAIGLLLILLIECDERTVRAKSAIAAAEQGAHEPAMEQLQESLHGLLVIRANGVGVGDTRSAEGALKGALKGAPKGALKEALPPPLKDRGVGAGVPKGEGVDCMRFGDKYDKQLDAWSLALHRCKMAESWDALRCNLVGSFLYVMLVLLTVPGRVNGTLTPGEGGFLIVNGAFLNLLLNMTIEFAAKLQRLGRSRRSLQRYANLLAEEDVGGVADVYGNDEGANEMPRADVVTAADVEESLMRIDDYQHLDEETQAAQEVSEDIMSDNYTIAGSIR
jgi:ABC-type multidrug transport system fused ATPase/permease subunit